MDDEPRRLRRTRELRVAGYSDEELRRLIGRGALTPVRRGRYVVGARPDDPLADHKLRVHAALDLLASGAVVSHVSAAVFHGLPDWQIPLDRSHVTRVQRKGGRSGTQVHVHTAPLGAEEIIVLSGVAVTSLARTVFDIARTVAFEPAVVVADAALATGLVDREMLQVTALRGARWPGSLAARRVIEFADGRSESVGESRSRVGIKWAGLPSPVLQWEVRSRDGLLVGRVDFAWPPQHTVGEFDGRIKYGRLLQPGQDAGEAVYQEKLREDAVRAEDLEVVRWGWADLRDFAPVAERLRRRFRQS